MAGTHSRAARGCGRRAHRAQPAREAQFLEPRRWPPPFFEALDIVRADRSSRRSSRRAPGRAFSSGLDLHFLRDRSARRAPARLGPAERHHQVAEAIRVFPRIMIAQVHGYCLGGALGIMNCHDLVFAAEDAQLGMPEVCAAASASSSPPRSSTAVPIKKVALIQLVGRNLSGIEADRLGIISRRCRPTELEAHDDRHRARNRLAPPGAARTPKIAVQMGRDLSLSQAIQLDMLVGARMRRVMDPHRRRRRLSQVAEGRPEYGLQAAGCVIRYQWHWLLTHPHRHGRACPGHPRLAFCALERDVDARDSGLGHDERARNGAGGHMSGASRVGAHAQLPRL